MAKAKDVDDKPIVNGIYKPINQWRDDEKPREKLMQNGAAHLSDSELLAILIGGGTRNMSAVDLGKMLLDRYGSVSELAKRDFGAFRKIPGIGDAKAVTIAAAFELGRRIEITPFTDRKMIKTPEDIASYYIPRLRDRQTEIFLVLLLNTANQIFREITVSTGSLNSSIVHPREVFTTAITDSAASVMLIHNHPSGNPEPSREDIEITRRLKEAGEIIGIKVLDHLIIAGNTFTSLARKGMI